MTPDVVLDTIVAPATPVGRSALALVRIDGPLSLDIARALTGKTLEPARATFVHIADGGEPIDDGIAVRYAAPHSFTGNDSVELSLHGNPLLVGQLLRAAVAAGARVAEPGEFTERAVLNGKLDLLQAEAIGALIGARTKAQARLSLLNLNGELSRTAGEIRQALLSVIARLEAALDFSDEGYTFIERDETGNVLREALERCFALRATFARGRATVDGISLAIVGRPNAGKSTLLNQLVGSDRAIVTAIPGTTRDVIRETIEIGGLPVSIADTAGLRATIDPVESIGVDRARIAASHADIILYVIDASVGIIEDDIDELAKLGAAVRVYTKVDLASAPVESLGVSAIRSGGMEPLLTFLDALIRSEFAVPEGSAAIVNVRQDLAAAATAEALEQALLSLQEGADEQIVLVDLNRAAASLGELTGAITRDEILGEIFSRFCIGK